MPPSPRQRLPRPPAADHCHRRESQARLARRRRRLRWQATPAAVATPKGIPGPTTSPRAEQGKRRPTKVHHAWRADYREGMGWCQSALPAGPAGVVSARGSGPVASLFGLALAACTGRLAPTDTTRRAASSRMPSSLSDFAVSAKSDRVVGRLGLGQEALSEGNGSCGARSSSFVAAFAAAPSSGERHACATAPGRPPCR